MINASLNIVESSSSTENDNDDRSALIEDCRLSKKNEDQVDYEYDFELMHE